MRLAYAKGVLVTDNVIVDVANVMGSRPDGWWRDRAGAAERLYGEIVALAFRRADIGAWVCVFEGRARAASVRDEGRVRVVRADGSGDDAIAALAGSLSGSTLVLTADRELASRCVSAGASVAGPGWLLGQFHALRSMEET